MKILRNTALGIIRLDPNNLITLCLQAIETELYIDKIYRNYLSYSCIQYMVLMKDS